MKPIDQMTDAEIDERLLTDVAGLDRLLKDLLRLPHDEPSNAMADQRRERESSGDEFLVHGWRYWRNRVPSRPTDSVPAAR